MTLASDSHEYRPDAKTGQCLDCPPRGSHGCLWCSHGPGEHTGEVDKAVLAHYAIPGGAMADGTPITVQSVQWTPKACSVKHCACRRYEVRR